MSGVIMVLLARAGRRPGRWLLPALGIALAVAFGGAVLAEGTITGTQAARTVLSALSPLDRAVRVSWEGPVTATARAEALRAFSSLELPAPTEVVLLDPVRLNGLVVRPAAIAPLGPWLGGRQVGPCSPSSCPMLLADGTLPLHTLTTSGVRIDITGSARLTSAAALSFIPEPRPGEPPVLLTGDLSGLNALAGLSGIYRSHSWVSVLDTRELTSWQLSGLERRLQAVQAALLADSPQFTIATPAIALDQARAEAAVAPHRLLLAGGGAVAALLLFVVLAAAGLRRDQAEQLERLRTAGARSGHCLAFVAGEAAWLCGLGALAGAAGAVVAGAVLASAAGVPVDGALTHSLLNPVGAAALGVAWLVGTLLLVAVLAAPAASAADGLAVAAVAALVLALWQGGPDSGPLALVLVPLGCLAAGVLICRGAAQLLRAGERTLRNGPVLGRLAFVGLARAPGIPALAIAFVAVSTGLGGFALIYRATLVRGSADEAAAQVPLDALVSSGPDFATPLSVASLGSWERLAHGTVLSVQRTDASFVSGGASVTVPALGVPATGLPLIHAWRSGELPAPTAVLARRLAGSGPIRNAGPRVPTGTQRLALRVASPDLAVNVAAELRDRTGAVTQVELGVAGPSPATVAGTVPPGVWEIEALELTEPTGLQVTNEHQNGENIAAATQATVPVTLGPLRAVGPGGATLASVALGGWRGVAAATTKSTPTGRVTVAFQESGLTGVVRPAQPSDSQPLPVLTDPQTAAAAGRGHRLGLSMDGLPVAARVVGVLPRFPSVPSGSAGFVIADQARLASALEAELPGQGRPNELWISTSQPGRLRAALAGGPMAQLDATFRDQIQRGLSRAPVARAVLGMLIGAAALCGALAVLGLLVALLGTLRDRRMESDLRALGLGPRALRAELRLRLVVAGGVGVIAGLAVALILTRLAVAAVRAGAAQSVPDPPLVTVVPGGVLALWVLGAFAAVGLAGWLGSQRVGRVR